MDSARYLVALAFELPAGSAPYLMAAYSCLPAVWSGRSESAVFQAVKKA